MGKTMLLARLFLYMGLFLNIPIVTSQTTVQGNVGDRVLIPCPVSGSYNLPQWIKAGAILTSQNVTGVNPAYPRISIDTDQKTLVVTSAQLNDSGTYECTHTAGTNSPQNVIVVITEATTTQPGNNSCNETCCEVTKAVCGFFVPDILVITVVIIKCSHILIGEHKRQKEKKKNGKHKDNDGQNGCIGTEKDRIRKLKIVWGIIIAAAVIFIAVSVWFIVMQATDEDCEEICECDDHIGLLAFEVVDFVLGVGFVIYLFYNYRDYPTCDQCGGVKKPPSSGPTAAVKPTADNNPDPLGDTGPHYPDVSPRHRPQPALPPKERHGSDLSSVSRRDVKLDPIPPIRKNISTTEFHMDNPESERCNIKVSSRGLSAVFDQEFDQPRTNRLAPLDHTVRDESIRRKKKKKKTRTNNDNVKFDNDYE